MALHKARLRSAVLDGMYNVKDDGAVGDSSTDDTAAMQAAFNRRGNIYFPPGSYRFTAPIKIYQNTHIYGVHRGSIGGSVWVPDMAGSAYPIQIDGTTAPDAANWVYNLDIEDIYIDASNWTGTATHFMNISAAYTCRLNRVTISAINAVKKAVRISKVNQLELDNVRLNMATTAKAVCALDVVDTDGAVSGLILKNCDIEIFTTGIQFTGSTYPITCDIHNHYAEANATYIDWNSSHIDSRLSIFGGHFDGESGSTGVKIRQSNVSIFGMAFVSGGLYAIDTAGASSSNGLHVFGGKFGGSINDPSKYLTTTNAATASGGGDLRGRVTFGGATTAAVTFNYLLDNATYYVAISAGDSKTYWVTAKTTAGFTLNASAASSADVDWIVRN